MGRSRGSRSGRSGRVAANPAVVSGGANDCVELPLGKAILQEAGADLAVHSALKLPLKALAHVVDGSDSIPSTTSPSHAGTAVSTPTSHGTMMANTESMSNALDETIAVENMVNDLISQSHEMVNDLISQSRERAPSFPVAALAPQPSPASRGPEPWALPGSQNGTPSTKSAGYRDLLRSRGRLAMEGSNLWKPIAVVESGVKLSENLPAVQALGLMWNAAPAIACPPAHVAQLPFDATLASTAPSGQFFMQPQIPPMSPSIAPMHAPVVTPDNRGVNQLLAVLGPLAGLSNFQIEGQLRAAAAQIVVYDD